MKTAAENLSWRLIGQSTALPGFAFGSRYPGMTGVIAGHEPTQQQFSTLVNSLREILPNLENTVENLVAIDNPEERFKVSVEWLLATMHEIQTAAELPVYERGHLVFISQWQARFYLPTVQLAFFPLFKGLQVLLELMNLVMSDKSITAELQQISQALTELKKISPMASNVPRFVRAAFDMAIPFQELPGQIFQYGQGKRGHWMRSSFTEETSQISAQLARNKPVAAAILRQAGIPVPDHQLVADAETALKVAERLGYPVVVKPADLDGGVGVAAGLLSPEEVKRAFQAIQRPSMGILVEKHVEGKDYRVTVLHGDVILAVERVPAGVTGDGLHTVHELVEQLNSDPRRGKSKHSPLKHVMLNDEAVELMRQAGLEATSVPSEGQFVRLRRAANIAAGGVPVAVLDRMHPDNRHLAIRAVQALRLDLGGVDLLMPDISRSWRETGAAICEVNGQPTIGSVTGGHLYPVILRKLVPGSGRIPTVVVLGDVFTSKLARTLELMLLRNKLIVGCHDSTGVRVNGEVIREGAVEPFTAGQMLSIDQNVGAIVLSINDDSVLRTGLPFARFDVLVIAGVNFPPQSEAANSEGLGELLRALLYNILPACDGAIIAIENPGLKISGFEHVTSAGWQHFPNENYGVLSAVLTGIDAAEARHQTDAIAPQR
jgi:cyanophycin synthetase